MANWRRRRQGGEFHDQEARRMRSDYRKPSQQEIWRSTVPSWEKEFCWSVGAMPWSKFLENKRYVHLWDKILDWDDSAGEEAFNNAKRRFWAKINRAPCDIPSPDPDTNIDAVDWDSAVDPALYLDLQLEKERRPPLLDDPPREDPPLLTAEALRMDPTFVCTGWGDEVEADAPVPQPDTGFQAKRRYRRRRKNGKHPMRQWEMKPCAQVS